MLRERGLAEAARDLSSFTQFWDVVKSDAHGAGFVAALGFHRGSVVENAVAVVLVYLVHRGLQFFTARIAGRREERRRVAVFVN